MDLQNELAKKERREPYSPAVIMAAEVALRVMDSPPKRFIDYREDAYEKTQADDDRQEDA